MDVVLEASRLTKRFGEVLALNDVSFTVTSPGLTGILGPNGAGKTTLLDILEGLDKPTSGSFELFGKKPQPYPKRRIGVVMQQEAQLERVTTREYAELFAAIYGTDPEAILRRAELRDRARTPMARLSGGEAARLFIATAITHEPDLLFLDEPTAHLDPDNKRQVGALLAEVARERCVIMTTHDLAEADALCDRLLFLVAGRVRAEGTRAELLDALPAGKRSVDNAFFHYCDVRMRDGELA